jgi:hypothetical protein
LIGTLIGTERLRFMPNVANLPLRPLARHARQNQRHSIVGLGGPHLA